jgi:hypothetical protein
MRERTTWNRQMIASQLRKVAEDPRAMNQDHIQRQPAADAYLIGDGSPSQFAEDVNSGKGGWKADLGSDGNTRRNEIGMPEFRGDTFKNPESSPGVSPSRQASLSIDEVHAKAELATRAARKMLPKTASEQAVEDQALLLMDLPTSSLQSTLSRLAQQDQDDDEDEDDEDDGGSDKQAQEEEDEDEGQDKKAKGLPPEFLEQQQKMKDKGGKGDKSEDEKESKKEARSRRFAEDDDEKKQSQQQDKGQGDDKGQGQGKEARARKAQQQSDDEDEGQDKEAADQDEKKQSQQEDKDKEACGDMSKEASALIRQAATGLLSVPQTSRHAAFKAMLPMLLKSASQGLQDQNPVAQQQLQSQVQQLVQQAMQQQLADQQQQQVAQGQQQQQVAQGQQGLPQLAQGQQQMPQLGQQQMPQLGQQQDSQALVDELFQDPEQGQQIFAHGEIQLDSPSMDIGDVTFGPEDAALQSIFASEPEVQRAMQANALQGGATPSTRTASTRTVGTRPTEGVSQLGGAVSSVPAGTSNEISLLSGMWRDAPDVSAVFRS